MFMSCHFPLQPRHVDGVLYVDFYGISTVNNRQRIKIGVMVCWAVMATLSRAYQSEGLGSREARRRFQLHERGAQVCGDQWMRGYLSGRGVGGRVVIALSSLVFPHDQVFR